MGDSQKAVALKSWSSAVGKIMELFKEGTEMMVRDHQKSNVKTSSFAIHLRHMAEREISVPVQHSLEVLSTRLDEVETERLKVMAQLQALVVNQFNKYPGALTVQQTTLQKRNQAVSHYNRANEAFASAQAAGRDLSVARGNLQVADQHLRQMEDLLNKGVGDFELLRITEIKEFLKRYIRNEIYFHSQKIEKLTSAYQEVIKIDPEVEKAIFLRKCRDMELKDTARLHQSQQQPAPSPVNNAAAANVAAGPTPASSQQFQPQQSQSGLRPVAAGSFGSGR